MFLECSRATCRLEVVAMPLIGTTQYVCSANGLVQFSLTNSMVQGQEFGVCDGISDADPATLVFGFDPVILAP